MKEATKRAASQVFAQTLAVTAMLVIASVVFIHDKTSLRGANATKQSSFVPVALWIASRSLSSGAH
jgi:hypothetical protein